MWLTIPVPFCPVTLRSLILFSFTDISVYSAVTEFGVVFFKQAFDVLQNVFHFISLLSIPKNGMFFFLVTSYCGAMYM